MNIQKSIPIYKQVQIGDKKNKLTMISAPYKIPGKGAHFCLFRFECGNEKEINLYHFASGDVQSCGCHRVAIGKQLGDKKKHDMSFSPEYTCWSSMKNRCFNENGDDYEHYMGRGITVCERWLGEHGFENFYIDMGPRLSARNNA